MIRGSLTEADWARLRDYTRTVSKFIVADHNDSKERISPAAFLRLARLQHPDMPLLPHLSDLAIEDADASIAYLDLLLTPSLKSLKASCIPDAQQSTFSCFLTAIEQEVPLLQTLILGPGRFLPSSLQTISQFNSLRHLELKLEDSKLPFAFFGNIGSLAMLETFILDARYVSGTMTGDEPTVLPPFPSDNFPNSNAMDGNPEEHGAADVRHSKTCRTPMCSFNQLAVLHVIGWLPLLEDLIHRVTSTKLEDVSVTFIRLSYDELKVSLAKEKAEREMKAEEGRRREEAERKMKEQEKMLKAEMERERIDEERRWREEAEKKMKEQEKLWEDGMKRRIDGGDVEKRPSDSEKYHLWGQPFGGYVISEPSSSSESARPWGDFAGGHTKKKTMKKQETTKKKQDSEVEVRERLLMEQERLASLSFEAHTVSFTEVLRKLCLPSLKSLYVCQLGVSFQCLLKPSTLSEEAFRTMLLLPAIESLEVKGWILDSVESVLSAAETIPNLKCLLLPLGEPNSSISLPTLRHVAKTCPKLESFQCYIDSLSPVPEYSLPTDAGLSHGLRTLSVGSSFPHPVAKQLYYLIARHLYLLFPELRTINTFKEHDMELWVSVDEFVKIFQIACMDDLNRQ
jgi:hypothetical protein